jgi:hypothetical protein
MNITISQKGLSPTLAYLVSSPDSYLLNEGGASCNFLSGNEDVTLGQRYKF